MTTSVKSRNVRSAPTGTIGALAADLHYHAADLRASHPEAAAVLREAACNLERCIPDADAQGERFVLPESVRGAIEYALSSKH